MSQVCPSVSHQLAAASIAFRNAREKFPKDYGVRSKDFKSEVDSAKRNKNDQKPVSSLSAKCMSNKENPHGFCSKSACSDYGPRYLSLKQQGKCMCRRRNEETFDETTRWSNDRSALGDIFDKATVRGNCMQDSDPKNSIDPCKYGCNDSCLKFRSNNMERERKKCTCCCSMSSRKCSRSGSSKLDTLDLLYVAKENRNNVNSMDGCECLVREDEARHHFSRRNSDDQELRGSCSKLDRSLAKREEKISPLLRTCDPRSPRDINLDLLRGSPEDHRPRSCHRYSCRRRCCYCCQQKSERISNFLPVGCTCLSIPGNRRGCSWKNHKRTRPCGKMDENEEKEEEGEDEDDENVGVIDHKDSIAILMEKYKSRNARSEHFEKGRRDRFDEHRMEKEKERINDRCENSSILRVHARENRKDFMESIQKNSGHQERCRCQENRRRLGEKERTLLHDDGRNRIRGEGDFYRRKEESARSRFEAPWRHTF